MPLTPEALTPNQARDLLEIVEDRYDKGSLIHWSPEGFQRQRQGVLFKRHAIAELVRTGDERHHTAEAAIVLLAGGNPVKQPLTEPRTHLLKCAP